MSQSPCKRCKRVLPIVAREFCNTCYVAWRRANKPDVEASYRKKYADTHRTLIRDSQQRYYLRNREAILTAAKNRRIQATEEQKRLMRDRSLKSAYGIGIDDYQRMHDDQKGLCGICSQKQQARSKSGGRPLHVDHDHQTGQVRGLLCQRCNVALGYVESAEWLNKALKYLPKK